MKFKEELNTKFKEGLIDERLDMTQLYTLAAQKANCTQGCTTGTTASSVREGILPLSALMRPQVE